MDDASSPSAAKRTSARKADSNRRNARKSTGPRTEQGKAWSRLNSLKHGILASQAVLTAIEGRENRAAFAQIVEGLAADFEPVGTFEQLLVEKIATCFWRFRRLLRFESRASFTSCDRRTYDQMNHDERWRSPLYVEEGARAEDKFDLKAHDVLEQAGLGMDLPSEHDMLRLVRYENSIERTMSKALAQLKAHQKARRESTNASAPTYADRAVVIDHKASERNGSSKVVPLGATASWKAYEDRDWRRRKELEELEAEAAAEEAESGETKPNLPEDPKALERQQSLIQAADSILKLSASMEPKRREPEK